MRIGDVIPRPDTISPMSDPIGTVRIGCRVPEEFYDRIVALAEARGVSLAQLQVIALTQFIERERTAPEEEKEAPQ